MYRETVHEDLIDLGAASAETKGGPSGTMDFEGTLKSHGGLAAD
jgi:hypothetical protein